MATEGEAAPTTEGETTPEPGTEEVTEQTPVEGGEGTPEGGETAVEGEPAAVEPKAATPAEVFAALPETEQQAIAKKYANGTMAAARRAEARVEAVKGENTKLSGELGTYREFVQQLASGDPAALARVGFKSPRDYLDKVVAFGGERPAPTAEDRVAALEKERADEKAAQHHAEASAAVEASFTKIFAAVDAKTDQFDLVTTDIGHATLREAIEAYFDEHKECPDEAVWAIAEEVEKDLAAKLAKSKRFGQSQPAKNGTATGTAAPGTLNPGKTLTSKASSGAPSVKELSMDPDERRRQVTEQMRAAGEL